MHKIVTFLNWLGLIAGAAFLLLQMGMTIDARLTNGDNLIGAIWYLSAFFTILTNIGILMVHVSVRTHFGALNWFRQPNVRTMVAALIFMVMAVYHFVLAPLWQPQGWAAVADTGLHYATPIIYLSWWGLHHRKFQAQFDQLPLMLLPPILYLCWAMFRGFFVDEYPYHFINLTDLGLGQTLFNIVVLFSIILALFVGFIAVERKLPKS